MNDFYVESFGHDERSTQFTQNGCCDSLVASDYKQPIIVAYIMDAMSSNSMKSQNPHSGFHEANVAKCLDTRCLEPSCNQGGMIVVHNVELITKQLVTNYNIAPTLEATDYKEPHLVCYEGQNCCTDTETAFTIQAGRPDDHHIPAVCYGVYSHPHASVMKIEERITPTITSKIAKGSADGPLVLINHDTECLCGGESSERQPCHIAN